MCLDQSKAHLPAAQERSSLQLQSALAHLSTGWAECQSEAGRRSKRGQDAQGAQGLKISTSYRRPSSAGDPDVPPTAPCRQPVRLWGDALEGSWLRLQRCQGPVSHHGHLHVAELFGHEGTVASVASWTGAKLPGLSGVLRSGYKSSSQQASTQAGLARSHLPGLPSWR